MQSAGKITLRALEVFLAASETGTLSAAAMRLQTSTSTVSQQITNLERALGTQLLDRAQRPIALTPAGVLFQGHAQSILDEISRARAKLMELQLAALPRLRLAMIDDLDATLTPDLVAELSSRYPQCAFEAWSGRSDEHLAALRNRAADITVAADDGEPEEWCERHVLLRECFVLVTAKGLVQPDADILQTLMRAPLVRYAARMPMGRMIEQHLRRLRLFPAQHHQFDSSHSVMAMVSNSGGWALTAPLSYLDCRRFHGLVDVTPMPMVALYRTVSLSARRNELGQLPAQMAQMCRNLIAARLLGQIPGDQAWLRKMIKLAPSDRPGEPMAASLHAVEEH